MNRGHYFLLILVIIGQVFLSSCSGPLKPLAELTPDESQGAISYLVETYAGRAIYYHRAPRDIFLDNQGRILMVDRYDKIYKIIPGGTSQIIFSNHPDIQSPISITEDSSGNIYVLDLNGGCHILKITPTGVVSRVVYDSCGYAGDGGPATAAQIGIGSNNVGITTDSHGNLFIPDYNNHRIRKIDATTGIITTVAGVGTSNFSGDDGLATSAELKWPMSVLVDSADNLYINDSGNNRIRKVSASTGIITTIAGTGNNAFSGDGGLATVADIQLSYAKRMGMDSSGNLYFPSNTRVRKIDGTTGIISTILGTGVNNNAGDGGLASSASTRYVQSVALDSSNNIFISDMYEAIRKIDSTTGIITTDYTTASYRSLGDGGAANKADLGGPNGISTDANGNLYITEWNTCTIRKVSAATKVITTIAGTGTCGFSGDGGLATSAQIFNPWDVVTDTAGNVYFSDYQNYRIRKIDTSGNISTIAGDGTPSYSGDAGPAVSAATNRPEGLAIDQNDNLYFAQSDNYVVRKINLQTGIITTVAGTGDTAGYSGDGGLATSATFNKPEGLSTDSAGNLYITDLYNHVIRKINVTTGIVSTIAGVGGIGGFAGDGGPATSANLNAPTDVAVDASGNLYITSNLRVRKVDTKGVISTIMGDKSTVFLGDGTAALSAPIRESWGIAINASGDVFFADYDQAIVSRMYAP